MATRRVAPISGASETHAPGPAPQRLWQWILVYPALAISFLSAAPQWLDKGKGYFIGVRSAEEAQRQAALWQKNASCVGFNSKGFLSPTKVAVDATICNSGDILVHAITPRQKEVFKWLPLDDVVRPAGGLGGLIPAAEAATIPVRAQQFAGAEAKPPYKLAMFQFSVICTRPNGRYLLRRISTPQGCFDEVIDTFTGALVSRNPAPCVQQC